MIALLLTLATGWAEPLQVPVLRALSPGDCAQSTPIQAGSMVSSSVIGLDGAAICTGVLMPPNQVAFLLQLEEFHNASERLHMLDVELLKMERDFYRDKLDTQLQPKPWYDRPAAQRWFGRIEVLIVVGIVTAGAGYVYNTSR